MKIRRLLAVSALALAPLMTLGAAAGPASAATTYSSVINTKAPMTFAPGKGGLANDTEATATKGEHVHMVAWQNPSSDPSHRYFFIAAANGNEGWVHAGVVSDQTSTPAASTVNWINAANWAMGQDGATKVPTADRNGTDATYWSGWCWLYSFDAWNIGAKHAPKNPDGSLLATYDLYKADGKMSSPTAMPPRGSLVFFSYDGVAGHVAISLGSGYIETTQGNEGQKLPVVHETIAKQGLVQDGYVSPGNI